MDIKTDSESTKTKISINESEIAYLRYLIPIYLSETKVMVLKNEFHREIQCLVTKLHKETGVWPSMAQLVSLTNQTSSKVGQALTKLVAGGYLKKIVTKTSNAFKVVTYENNLVSTDYAYSEQDSKLSLKEREIVLLRSLIWKYTDYLIDNKMILSKTQAAFLLYCQDAEEPVLCSELAGFFNKDIINANVVMNELCLRNMLEKDNIADTRFVNYSPLDFRPAF